MNQKTTVVSVATTTSLEKNAWPPMFVSSCTFGGHDLLAEGEPNTSSRGVFFLPAFDLRRISHDHQNFHPRPHRTDAPRSAGAWGRTCRCRSSPNASISIPAAASRTASPWPSSTTPSAAACFARAPPDRGHGRQHRSRTGAGGRRSRLPTGVRHAREDVAGQAHRAGKPRRNRRSSQPNAPPHDPRNFRTLPADWLRNTAGFSPISSPIPPTRASTNERPAQKFSRRPAARSAPSSPARAPEERLTGVADSSSRDCRTSASCWPTRSARGWRISSAPAASGPRRGAIRSRASAAAWCRRHLISPSLDSAERISDEESFRHDRPADARGRPAGRRLIRHAPSPPRCASPPGERSTDRWS